MSATKAMSLDRFKGCLIGGVMGDCLGAPFEGNKNVSGEMLANYFKSMDEAHAKKNLPYKAYTDDTAMTFALCRSLLEKNALELPNLTKHYAEEFMRDHRRGYGSSVKLLLLHLADNEAWKTASDEDVIGLAKAQFNGKGSFGNGAAMRVAPTALFHAVDDIEALVHSAHRQSLITHTNGLGILGAVLQAAAVHLALRAEGSIEVKNFINELKEILRKVEGVENGHKMSIDMEQFLRDLGNDISAHGAVPTAVYAFLKALQPLSEFKTSSGVVRTIFTAIRLGGDTDTISSMAASIAGAYYGQKDIPTELSRRCEAVEVAEDFASRLHARITI